MTADRPTLALKAYQRAQDELVEARNRLARAIAGAAMSGMDEGARSSRRPGIPLNSCCGSAATPVSGD
jgi:hypothetical protein